MAQVTYVVGSGGTVQKIPLAEYDRAVGFGASPATAEQVAAFKSEAEASTVGGIAKTVGEGLFKGAFNTATAIPRALSAGAAATGLIDSDPLTGMTGENLLQAGASVAASLSGAGDLAAAMAGQQYTGNVEARAAANPVAAGVGQFAGTVAGAELGGLGALGRAAKEGTAAALGGGMAARIAGGAAEGVAFTAPVVVADEAQKAAQAGSQLTGEQAASGLMHSLLTGAAFGGVFGGGATALGEALGAGKKGLGRIFQGTEGAALEGGAKPGAFSKGLGFISGKDPEAIASMLERSPEGAARRRLAVFEGDATRESAERDIRSQINQMEHATKNLTPEWRELKASNVAATIDSSPEALAQQRVIVTDRLATMREKINEMVGDKDVYGDRGNVNKLQRFLSVAEKDAGKALERGSAADAFVAMDDLKKKIGAIASKTRGNMGPASDKEVAQAATVLYEDLRQDLVHPSWGEAGKMQARVNDAFTEYLGTKDIFDQKFMTQTGKEGFAKSYGADPEKIGGYVRKLLDPAKDLDHSIIEQHISATQKLAEALAGAGEMTPAKQAELMAIKGSADAFSRQIDAASQALAATNKMDIMQKGAVAGQYGIGMGALVGHAAGAGIGALIGEQAGGHEGGIIGGTLGAVLGGLKDPARIVQSVAMLERFAAPMMTRGQDAIASLFASVGKGAAGAAEAAGSIRMAAPLSALELFGGRHKPEDAYPIRIQELAQAPQAMADRLGHVIGQDGIKDPAAAIAAFTAANKAVSYLQAHIPVGLHDATTLTPMTSKPSVSHSDVAEFASIWAAVMRPKDVLAGIPHGIVSSSQMDAIRTVYPQMYGWLQHEAMGHVQRADEAGHEIPLRQRDILDTLFDIGAAAGPTYSMDFAMKYGPKMGDKAQQATNKAHQSHGAPTLGSKRLSTMVTGQLSGNGA